MGTVQLMLSLAEWQRSMCPSDNIFWESTGAFQLFSVVYRVTCAGRSTETGWPMALRHSEA